MRRYKSSLAGLMLGPAIAAMALAERVPLRPEELKAEATHIVTGVVSAVYGSDRVTTLYGEGTIETHYMLEIGIEAVEKGDGLTPGELLYARCWSLKQAGAKGRMPGPGGHFGIPADGDRVRAFVVHGKYGPTGQSDRGWAVVYPNGIDKLEVAEKPVETRIPDELLISAPKDTRQTPTDQTAPSGSRDYWWLLWVGLVVVICVVGLGQAFRRRR